MHEFRDYMTHGTFCEDALSVSYPSFIPLVALHLTLFLAFMTPTYK